MCPSDECAGVDVVARGFCSACGAIGSACGRGFGYPGRSEGESVGKNEGEHAAGDTVQPPGAKAGHRPTLARSLRSYKSREPLTPLRCRHDEHHDATVGFARRPDDRWFLPAAEPGEVICHGDFATYNCVLVDGRVAERACRKTDQPAVAARPTSPRSATRSGLWPFAGRLMVIPSMPMSMQALSRSPTVSASP